jgi:hypothetical protein
MDLSGIIAISGKPGLFKVVAQGKNSIIVESLIDNKRMPAYASDRISALEDISIYTYDEDKPLKEVLDIIYTKENGGQCISHKEDASKLLTYMIEVLPNFDQERVYPSDIKKLYQWYNLLQSTGNLKTEETEVQPEEKTEVVAEEPKKKAAPKKAPAKAKTATEAAAKSSKPTPAKKVTATKTGSSRGK